MLRFGERLRASAAFRERTCWGHGASHDGPSNIVKSMLEKTDREQDKKIRISRLSMCETDGGVLQEPVWRLLVRH